MDPIGLLAHVIVYRETPTRTVRGNLELADELEASGLEVTASALREVADSGLGVGPAFRQQLKSSMLQRGR